VPVYPKTSAYTPSHWTVAATTLADAEHALYAAGAAGAAVRAGLDQVRATLRGLQHGQSVGLG
jgi:hypothetical protein